MSLAAGGVFTLHDFLLDLLDEHRSSSFTGCSSLWRDKSKKIRDNQAELSTNEQNTPKIK